jgi:hypothetical protein
MLIDDAEFFSATSMSKPLIFAWWGLGFAPGPPILFYAKQ